MDLYRIIRELHEERKRLDRLIAVVQKKLAQERFALKKPKSRRGRKFMGAEERKLVSERMARYWAARRASAAKHKDNDAGGSPTS